MSLIIGDSISIGYTLPLRKLLRGKANLHRPLTNCSSTQRGMFCMCWHFDFFFA